MAVKSSSVGKTVKKRRTGGKNASKPAPRLSPALSALLKAADHARKQYKYKEAIDLYTQAIESGKLDPAHEFDARDARLSVLWRVADAKAQEPDLEKMAKLARGLKDPVRRAHLLIGQVLAAEYGEAEVSLARAKRAVSLARKLKDPALEADALLALTWATYFTGEFESGTVILRSLVERYKSQGRHAEAGLALLGIGVRQTRLGNLDQGVAALEEGLQVFRSLGDRASEAFALGLLGMSTSDMARQLDLTNQSLQIHEAIDRSLSSYSASGNYNNLCVMYWNLGLHPKSRDLGEMAVSMQRAHQNEGALAYSLESLARPYFALGRLDQALALVNECLAISRKIKNTGTEGACLHLLGRIAQAQGEPQKARRTLQAALKLTRSTSEIQFVLINLAWLAGADLALKDQKAALRHSAEAVALLEKSRDSSSDYPPQEVWWWRYRALRAGKPRVTAEAFAALERARELMLAQVADISDEGLRRNFLNKVAVNRQIALEWAKVAATRRKPLELPEARAGSLAEQLRRASEIGQRLNEEHNEADLLDLVLDEAVELSGAERAILLLKDEAGNLVPRAGYLLSPTELASIAEESAEMTGRAAISRQPVLAEDKGSEKEPAYLRKVRAALPLLLRGQAIGVLYVDMSRLFGRLGQEDLDLLRVLCNQAASALENARLVSGLEEKVKERTTELNQRLNELAIINSVQEALAKQLDLQAIIDMVNQKVGEIFAADTTVVFLYDAERDWYHHACYVDRGERMPLPDGPAQRPSLGAIVVDTGKPLLIGTSEESGRLGAIRLPRTGEARDKNESYLGVPILAGEKVIGMIAVQSYKQNAYGQEDVRLLQTLAAAMSVALENARLFDETQKLLKETEQRAAELAIINSVQEGLASKLDLQAIHDLVGEKIVGMFNARAVAINSFDHSAQKTRS
ncbi:MAG TPA: GAF domain-containing protein, partial [Anaerolineales bacterium]